MAEELLNIFDHILYSQYSATVFAVGDDDWKDSLQFISSTCEDAKEKQLVHTTMSQQHLFTFYFPSS